MTDISVSSSLTAQTVWAIGEPSAGILGDVQKCYDSAMEKVCSEPTCVRKTIARGLCTLHYQRAKKAGLPNKPREKRLCSVDGCGRPYCAKGLCVMHWNRRKNGLPMGDGTPYQTPHRTLLNWLVEHRAYSGDECLTWPFARTPQGRAGTVEMDGQKYEASRAMCILAHGNPPFPGAEAAHSCGKGHEACVHPKHLRWATRLENVADMYVHGSICRGEKHYAVKLTEDDVRRIRADDRNSSELAPLFGVTRSAIRSIRQRRSWRHVA